MTARTMFWSSQFKHTRYAMLHCSAKATCAICIALLLGGAVAQAREIELPPAGPIGQMMSPGSGSASGTSIIGWSAAPASVFNTITDAEYEGLTAQQVWIT